MEVGTRKDIRNKEQSIESPSSIEIKEVEEAPVFEAIPFKLPKFDETLPPYKVLLVKTAIEHPIREEDFGVPMGLYVLKDYLNTTGHNLEIDVWDERLAFKGLSESERKKQKQTNELFGKELEKNYDAVGISMCTSEVIPALKKFQLAKANYPNIITFCGGIFTASNEKYLLETNKIDYVIPGIATKPLGDLLVKLYKYKTITQTRRTQKEKKTLMYMALLTLTIETILSLYGYALNYQPCN